MHIIYKDCLFIVDDSHLSDPSFTESDKRQIMMAVAVQEPATEDAYFQALKVAHMWVYRNRGCRYSDFWEKQITAVEKALT